MIVVMQKDATEEQIEFMTGKLNKMGFEIHRDNGADHTVLGVIGDTRKIDGRIHEIEVRENLLFGTHT